MPEPPLENSTPPPQLLSRTRETDAPRVAKTPEVRPALERLAERLARSPGRQPLPEALSDALGWLAREGTRPTSPVMPSRDVAKRARRARRPDL